MLSLLSTKICRRLSSPASRLHLKMVKYITQEEAINIDEELFTTHGFSVDQLMELAGLSCAQAIAKTYPIEQIGQKDVFLCCGPGNNGGDGLVCARHLRMYGYNTLIYYPRPSNSPLFVNLVTQCTSMNIPISDKIPSDTGNFGLIVDALFGFSFRPPVRPHFEEIINLMKNAAVPLVSVDVPSGWEVEKGEPEEGGVKPEMLISLTAPKQCAEKFQGKYHILGGRFVPPSMDAKFNLNIPPYPGTDLFIQLPN